MITLFLKIALPVVILGSGAYACITLIENRPAPETRVPEDLLPLVETMEVSYSTERLRVRAEGTVVPRTETDLVPEVSGRVIEVSPALVAGGYFEEGEVLLRLDPRDYELGVTHALAAIAQAEVRLQTERQEADAAAEEWKLLGQGPAAPLAMREPQIAEAEAALAAAQASLRQAEYDLDRTIVRAPFRGRVRTERVDVGQFGVRGNSVATLYAVDAAEVRLPIPDRELEYLNVSLSYPSGIAGGAPTPGPEVVLRSEFAGGEHEWRGHIVRTEGEIDPQTRMVHVIARVEDPYAQRPGDARPPLAVGMFVEAEILGRSSGPVAVVPRSVLRAGDRVLVVDESGVLRIRQVDIFRRERNRILIGSGLKAGERMVVSPLENAIDGMKVRLIQPRRVARIPEPAEEFPDNGNSGSDSRTRQVTEEEFYVVQLGAFLRAEGAEKLRQSFELRYPGIYVVPPQGENPFHKVQIRRPRIDDAYTLRERLKRDDGLDTFLVPPAERALATRASASALNGN